MSDAARQPLRLGTRASRLAVVQSQWVADRLASASGRPVELVTVTSEGDTNRASLASLGGTGVFASALRAALLDGRVDVLVHSMKDLPTAPFDGLDIAAVPKRADARDALCARNGATIDTLPEGAAVGTGSPRRVAQLRQRRPDIEVLDIRGNVDTRLARIDADLDAVVLASAGLSRMGQLGVATELLDLGFWPTAAGQGALAVEIRANEQDAALVRGLRKLDHAPSRLTATAERAVLARLEAGCAAPVGVSAVIDAELLLVTATVYRTDGTAHLTASHGSVLEQVPAQDRLDDARAVAVRVADELLMNGAGDLADIASTSR